MEYQVIIGWGFNSEDVILETTDRSEAREVYEQYHIEWLEAWQDEDIDCERAQMERPYLCIVTEEDGRESI